MTNPLYNRKFLAAYSAAWFLVAMLHFLFLVFFIGSMWQTTIPASIIPVVIFAFFGIGVWYIVKYSHFNKREIIRYIHIIIAGLFILFIWALSVVIIMKIVHNSFSQLQDEEILWYYILSPGVFYYAILALIFKLIILLWENAEKKAAEERLQKLLIESKLNAIKAYINPHFLFNSLNSVNSLINSDPERARIILINMSDYFRACIKNKDSGLIKLEDEINNVYMYFDIERERFFDRIEFEQEIDRECLNAELPPMILQPLFENIIKHAVTESIEKINIKLKISSRPDDYVEIQLSNNYNKDIVPSLKGEGLGLDACRRRMSLQFSRDDLFFVNKSAEIFNVIILLPKK
jgi:two-component system, LytTR family, sensor kinase